MKDRRQRHRLEVHSVEDRPLVDQIDEAAHALHLGNLSAGFVALAGKDRVKSMAQLGQPVGRDDLFQNDEAVGVQCAALSGLQRLGDEPPVATIRCPKRMFLRLATGLLLRATRIAGTVRQGLERLGRYLTRPALALGRLRILDSQRLSFALKTPWSDGTSHLLLAPMELLEKRAALVPPPRFHLLRYHRVRTYPEGVGLPAVPPQRGRLSRSSSSPPDLLRDSLPAP